MVFVSHLWWRKSWVFDLSPQLFGAREGSIGDFVVIKVAIEAERPGYGFSQHNI